MIRLPILAALLCFSMSTYSLTFSETSLQADTSLTTKGYINDLDTLKSWIENIHPLPFARITEAEWNVAFNKAQQNILADTNKLAKTLAMTMATGDMLGVLKDSHTMISLGVWAEGGNINTLTLASIGEDVFVKEDLLGLIAPGTRVKTINGLLIDDVFENAMRISPQEGNAWLSKVRFAEKLIIPMALAMSDGEFICINGMEYRSNSRVGKARKQGVSWEFEERIVKLNIRSFSSGSSSKYYREIQRGFKKLRKNDVDRLVIDLRGNMGGSSARMEEVIRHLTHEEVRVPIAHIKGIGAELDTIKFEGLKLNLRNTYEGPVVVLMDGLSSSASVSFVTEFRRINRGVVLGEPCNGPNSGTFAGSSSFRLPNSGLEVMISTERYVLDEGYAIRSQPIKPSRWIQWSEQDLTEERDPFDDAVQDWSKSPMIGDLRKVSERESKVLWEEMEMVFSRERLWGGVREKVWSQVVEGDICVKEAKALGENFKQCKTARNVLITLALPKEMRTVFEGLIAPGRPAVLHFGIHNRMDCNVCLPK